MTQAEIMQTIKDTIKEKGMSQNAFCVEIMMEPKNLREWFNGTVNPKLPTLLTVLDALGLKLEVTKA